MAKKKSGKKTAKKIESVRHKDKRKNIPTEELRDFVKEDEAKPQQVKYPGLLYARDSSLDPQLVWKGKDEQDQEELTVPAVPIYIQEKIHPHAIIEDVRAQAKKGKGEQLNFFADFNGIEFEELIEFYQHDTNWSNRMILGDSLLVMTSLAEKEGLKGKVQMIYIDPPYGIKFGSNWQVSTRKRDVKDGKAQDATRQPEQIRAFRDTWELGIHSYLTYWRDRLIAARELLTETGSVFVQIGDENVHLVRSLLDEVFGADNFISQITLKKMGGLAAEFLAGAGDYILWFGKHKSKTKYRQLYLPKIVGEGKGTGARYDGMISPFGERARLPKSEAEMNTLEQEGWRIYQPSTLTTFGSGGSSFFEFAFEGYGYWPSDSKGWLTTLQGLQRLAQAGRVVQTGNSVRYVRCLADFAAYQLNNIWTDIASPPGVVYVVQTSTATIARCMLMATDPGDLVLDPTCGGGTTAYVAEQWGRRWITIDTSRVALALARTRLMTARYPYYLLADSQEGIKKEAEVTGQIPPPYKTSSDIKKGFIYDRVPHIMLKDIANNEEIDTIHAKWQEKLEPVRKKLNGLLKKSFEEWEIPREAEEAWYKNAKELLKELWELRQRRQKEIDASIARNADTEMLYDKPYVDNKRIRVTGPFTVESLSPHRTISVEEKKELAEVGKEGWAMKMVGAGQFGNIIIENLKKAGIQNTIKNERLKFDRLEVHAGVWIHAEGEYSEKDSKTRRVAVCIGPEHGTVGPELVKEAAKEAVQGIGYDMLVICGFAFDPHVSEEAKRYGKLTVLPTRINADLQMGEEFLKKTVSANLFMVFGEPDLEVSNTEDGKIEVEIKGLDIYDPTTGEIRSNTTDDIACWFIDTNYNGESFFIRHAYFTGADKPYEKLKRALRAEVNEEAWSMLYSNKSRPFDSPETGKIAVKVINHYGDEVLKVYDVAAVSE
ncbi:site-specific DNA-methyltransferase [Planctomycetota bacterium]